MICSLALTGCTVHMSGQQEIPETTYEKVGYAVSGRVEDDGTVVVTYALIGVNENMINYIHLDQIKQNPQKESHVFTNKELGSAYGLSYTSEKGEWNEQVQALESYIKGKTVKGITTFDTAIESALKLFLNDVGIEWTGKTDSDIVFYLKKKYND
jgi:hypothetical protein